MKKLTTEEFIKRCSIIHDFKYDYSLVVYNGKRNKIKIICPIHGVFEQLASNHLHQKRGCKRCGFNLIGEKTKFTLDEFIEKSNNVHNNKYDYSLSEYKSIIDKLSIICPIHGVFTQTPNIHLKGSGCYECGIENMKLKLLKPIESYINDCNKIHNKYYDYSLVEYKRISDKIKIICPTHGVFEQRASSHSEGNGCKKCSKSRGEIKIEEFLNKNNIVYEYQKTFEECVHKNKLSFDFYLMESNICIEYDGIQHSEALEYFGGEKRLIYQQKLDMIKNNFCKKNNIEIIRINYKKYNKIWEILNKKMK